MPKNKKSFAWLGFVLILIVAGLVYLRVRSLRNQGKRGKDIALDFIPGVGDLVYAISGSTMKHEPIASDTQHGYMRNTAASMKELKMMEEQEKKAELAAQKKPVQMHKRPKELSVNHAAATAKPAEGTEAAGKTVAAAAVAAGGITSRDDEAKRPASPFKSVEGVAPVAKPAIPFKPATKSNANGTMMTSAFKPSTGAHNPSDKIVSSAFKPSSGAHNPSDKIVSSAFKPTQKFTPQKGPDTAQVTHTENDSVKLARERAAAAREQQAMREAMKTQKPAAATTATAASAAASKAEVKQHAPIKRPSAFSVNRAAAAAAGTAETAKPVNEAPASEPSKSGPAISPFRAKASSNSNQLGNMLNSRPSNAAARTPIWASPNTAGISPFKQTAEAQEEAKADASNEAERKAALEAEAPKASYADQAKTHKSAFFSRTSAAKDNQSSNESPANAYGGIVRPTGIIGAGERKQQVQNAAMGTVLEGQKPAILDPDSHKAPTAAEPVFGFKPVDPENYGT